MESRRNIFSTKKGMILIASFCALLWGSAFPVLKTSYIWLHLEKENIIGKIYFAGLRFFIASLILFIFLNYIQKSDVKISKKQFYKLGMLGIIQTALQYFFFYVGLANTTGIKGAVLASSSTFFVIIFAHFYEHNDSLSWNKIIGLVLGFAGILAINIESGFGDLSFNILGEGFLIMSGIVGATGTILAKKMSVKINPFTLTAWQMIIGSSILLTIGIIGGGYKGLVFSSSVIALLIYASFLSAIAFALWYSLLKYNKASQVSMYKFLIPIFGTFLSILFIPSETYSNNIIIALILVSIGVVTVNRK